MTSHNTTEGSLATARDITAPEPDDDEVLLLRVDGTAPLAMENDLLAVREESLRTALSEVGDAGPSVVLDLHLDPFTKNRISFTGPPLSACQRMERAPRSCARVQPHQHVRFCEVNTNTRDDSPAPHAALPLGRIEAQQAVSRSAHTEGAAESAAPSVAQRSDMVSAPR